MKRMLTMILAGVLMLSMAACRTEEPTIPTPQPPETTAAETSLPPETEPVEETEAPTEPSKTGPAILQREPAADSLPGDPTAWNLARAEKYPSDADCTDRELLEKWLAVEGLTYADLEARDCSQLILVAAQRSDGVETITTCYQRGEDGAWTPVEDLTRMSGHTGSNGIRHNRKRNTNTSPAGLWALGMAFGNAQEPEGLRLPWRDVTPNSDWVCDAASIYFNTWQERDDPTLTDTWDYRDAEHLEDYPTQYAYACVIEYNTPPNTIPDRGCAIFLHCSKGATGGCIGLPEEDMVNTLLWLDPEQNPFILITGYEKG